MEVLNEEALARGLEQLPGWSVADGHLTRRFDFGSFREAITFVDQTADIAEELGHHPDLDIRYNKVRVAMMTHDSGGITELDLRLAARLNAL